MNAGVISVAEKLSMFLVKSAILNAPKFNNLVDWMLETLRLQSWNRNQFYSGVTFMAQC